MAPPEALPDVVALAAPAFIGLIAIELLIVRFGRRGAYEVRDMAASLAMGLGNGVLKIVAGGLAAGAFYWVSQFRLFDIAWTWWSLALCFLAEDLAYYWFHRISHESRYFWASHVIHHSSQHYNLSTALRQTWTGTIACTFIFWLPLPLIGFPVEMVFLFSGISLVYQFWIHTELIGKLGPLEWVLNTPSHHRVHHATNPQYLDRNYAGVLIIWDRLFASFEPEKEQPRYGILSNIATFNPLRVATHEWLAIGRDVVQARSIKDALRYVFGAPGWSHDGSRQTSAAVKAAMLARPAA